MEPRQSHGRQATGKEATPVRLNNEPVLASRRAFIGKAIVRATAAVVATSAT
jgi:hypothetical protein